MAYVRFHRSSMNQFMFAMYLKADFNYETIFSCMEKHSNKHNFPHMNIIAVATDGASAMVGHYIGFSVLLKETVPIVHTVHCVLHWHILEIKNSVVKYMKL